MNITELAKQAGFTERSKVIRTVHSNGSWVGINDELQAFAALVIEAHTEELLAGVGEPEAWQWLNTAHFRRKIPSDACDVSHWRKLYTADQQAAAVLRERERCAVSGWNHYMDTCKKQGIGPDTLPHWNAAAAIRGKA